jgi:lipopolysaccharide export system permease protein
MMSILERYLSAILIRTTLLALFVLAVLFAFFSLIDQLGNIGRGQFTVFSAIEYVALTMPRTMAELFPVAAVIGAMAGMGLLARNSELTVIRAAGVSQYELLLAVLKGGLILVLLAIFISEVIAPISEPAAQKRRSMALTDQISMQTRHGYWIRDGRSFINIRDVLPGNQFGGIQIYEFDRDDRLRITTYAERARHIQNEWRLENIVQFVIDEEGIVKQEISIARWDSLLNPEVINLVAINPGHLGLWDLYHYITYLKDNNQNALRYEQALWGKLMYPVSILVLLALSVPLVRLDARSAAIGQRIFFGVLIGIVFHLLNQSMLHLGVVFNLNPFFSTAMPSLLFLLTTLWLIQKSTPG